MNMNLQRRASVFGLCRIIAVAVTAWVGVCHHLHSAAIANGSLDRNNVVTVQHQTQLSQKEDPAPDHRRLFSLSNFFDPSSVAQRKPFGNSDVHVNSHMADRFYIPKLAPYNQFNITITATVWQRELFLLYYDPNEDAFLIYVDERKDEYEVSVWHRLNLIMPTLAFALRTHFPERFQPGAPDFITLVSSGEAPQMLCECIIEEERLKRPKFCRNEIFAPILQFGSVYKDTSILPNAVTMPTWVNLPCFADWQRGGSVCEELQFRHDVAGLLGGLETLDSPASGQSMPFSEWDSLVPSIIWRGSDLSFLSCIHPGILVDWDRDIAPRLSRFGNTPRGVLQSLLDLWDMLTPRWKAATLSVMAKLDAEEIRTGADEVKGKGVDVHFIKKHIPWIDAKFAVKSTLGHDDGFQRHGMPVIDEEMTLSQLSRYKYHIDLGGGGGTTWLGTLEKLAMPGVLFHHVTAAKDYYHDDLIAWVHYIPVNEDLSNLREMYDWAEENSAKAQEISKAATEYVEKMAKPFVMKTAYERYFVHSLNKVIDAYRPMEGDEAHEQLNKWLSNWSLVGKCSGEDGYCELKDWMASK